MDVFIGEGTNSSNVLFENNIFEAPTGSSGNANNAIYTSHAPDNWVVRYNTFGSSGITVVTDPTSRVMGRRQLLRRELAMRRAAHGVRVQRDSGRGFELRWARRPVVLRGGAPPKLREVSAVHRERRVARRRPPVTTDFGAIAP